MTHEAAVLHLCFGDERLGVVCGVHGNQPWMCGTFLPTKRAGGFRSFFRWMVDEDRRDEEPPFGLDLLDEENWSVRDAAGKRRGISIPAVHQDGTIMWRWRRTAPLDDGERP